MNITKKSSGPRKNWQAPPPRQKRETTDETPDRLAQARTEGEDPRLGRMALAAMTLLTTAAGANAEMAQEQVVEQPADLESALESTVEQRLEQIAARLESGAEGWDVNEQYLTRSETFLSTARWNLNAARAPYGEVSRSDASSLKGRMSHVKGGVANGGKQMEVGDQAREASEQELHQAGAELGRLLADMVKQGDPRVAKIREAAKTLGQSMESLSQADDTIDEFSAKTQQFKRQIGRMEDSLQRTINSPPGFGGSGRWFRRDLKDFRKTLTEVEQKLDKGAQQGLTGSQLLDQAIAQVKGAGS